jgi:ABC-type transport system substrate-binding protein
MRKLSIIGTIFVLLLGASMTVAASPAPSPSAPNGTTTAPSTASTTSTATTWSADLKPQTGVTGSVHFREASDGTGTVTLRLLGLARTAPWVVEIDGGSSTNPGIGPAIAVKSGSSVRRTGIDTLTIDLTKTEMRNFLRDLSKDGVIVAVSDGTHESVATLPAS